MSSGAVYKRPEIDSSGSTEDADDDEGNDVAVDETEKARKRKKRRVFSRFGVRKCKEGLLFRYRKFQKLYMTSVSSDLSSDSLPNAGSRKDSSLFSGKSRFGGGFCCCSCFSKPYVDENTDSQGNGVPDDPEEFRYEHIKSLIEGNDFYSKECDTHFDDD